jgi:hypothetical protein
MDHRTRLATIKAPLALMCALAALAAPGQSIASSQTRRPDPAYGTYVLGRLAEACGFEEHVRLGRGPVAYAQAMVIDDKATILYNPRSLDSLERETGTPWSAVSVLAHELGHHYYGHAHLGMRDANGDDIPRNELDADYFSGYALARVGARLHDAQAAQRTLNTEETLYHPSSVRRLHAIRAGWLDGAAGIPLSPEPWLRMESATPGRAVALRASLSGPVWDRLSLLSGQW